MEAEARGGVFDVVVQRLEDHGHKYAEGRGGYAYYENFIGRLFVEVAVPERPHQKDEAGDDTHSHAYAVGIDGLSEYVK